MRSPCRFRPARPLFTPCSGSRVPQATRRSGGPTRGSARFTRPVASRPPPCWTPGHCRLRSAGSTKPTTPFSMRLDAAPTTYRPLPRASRSFNPPAPRVQPWWPNSSCSKSSSSARSDLTQNLPGRCSGKCGSPKASSLPTSPPRRASGERTCKPSKTNASSNCPLSSIRAASSGSWPNSCASTPLTFKRRSCDGFARLSLPVARSPREVFDATSWRGGNAYGRRVERSFVRRAPFRAGPRTAVGGGARFRERGRLGWALLRLRGKAHRRGPRVLRRSFDRGPAGLASLVPLPRRLQRVPGRLLSRSRGEPDNRRGRQRSRGGRARGRHVGSSPRGADLDASANGRVYCGSPPGLGALRRPRHERASSRAADPRVVLARSSLQVAKRIRGGCGGPRSGRSRQTASPTLRAVSGALFEGEPPPYPRSLRGVRARSRGRPPVDGTKLPSHGWMRAREHQRGMEPCHRRVSESHRALRDSALQRRLSRRDRPGAAGPMLAGLRPRTDSRASAALAVARAQETRIYLRPGIVRRGIS